MATRDPVVDADFSAHVETYHSFLKGVALFIATAAVILLLMARFLL